MTIKVRCEVQVLEVDGKTLDTNAKNKPVIVVESDWRASSSMTPAIVITVNDTKYTVHGADMATAVANARNR